MSRTNPFYILEYCIPERIEYEVSDFLLHWDEPEDSFEGKHTVIYMLKQVKCLYMSHCTSLKTKYFGLQTCILIWGRKLYIVIWSNPNHNLHI